MKFIMATEAQRLISISLAKIAASRCVRGGVSLHKNLLVATVLQKARYIFMEEAFHVVHGHYINQANSKFIQQLRYQEQLENQLRDNDRDYDDDDDESTQISDSELDIFTSPTNSNESLNFLDDSTDRDTGTAENSNNSKSKSNSLVLSTSSSTTELIYLDLDVNNKSKLLESYNQQNLNSITGQKRRLGDLEDDDESDDNNSSNFPKNKQLKFSNNNGLTISLSEGETKTSAMNSNINNNNNKRNSNDDRKFSNNLSSYSTSNNLSTIDFLSNDLTSESQTHSENVMMTPLDMSNNTSALSSTSSTNTTNPNPISPTSSSIDRITSLVSIFNFGSLQRSVSSPDLCSSNHSSVVDSACCNLQQRQIAMTV